MAAPSSPSQARQPAPATKAARQARIVTILAREQVHSQEQLASLLSQYGGMPSPRRRFPVTWTNSASCGSAPPTGPWSTPCRETPAVTVPRPEQPSVIKNGPGLFGSPSTCARRAGRRGGGPGHPLTRPGSGRHRGQRRRHRRRHRHRHRHRREPRRHRGRARPWCQRRGRERSAKRGCGERWRGAGRTAPAPPGPRGRTGPRARRCGLVAADQVPQGTADLGGGQRQPRGAAHAGGRGQSSPPRSTTPPGRRSWARSRATTRSW